ncbi:hypothetical protein [Photobacterium sp.]|uniref:hypothetical protein n=1 Tax=Photobacterium sp. TaxID=660 RepID=UPI00299E94B5|nr:hypothetical protein [Photobacterium sp.]MDX1302139.1 hypothetical protein [Photobacterium sp.]
MDHSYRRIDFNSYCSQWKRKGAEIACGVISRIKGHILKSSYQPHFVLEANKALSDKKNVRSNKDASCLYSWNQSARIGWIAMIVMWNGDNHRKKLISIADKALYLAK